MVRQRVVDEFQAEVLQILDEVQPGIRDEIIRRLKQRNIIRRSVRHN